MTRRTVDKWPFGTDEHDPLAVLRIPVVHSPHPGK